MDDRDLKSLNAPRTLLVSAANAVAVLAFVAAGVVRWPQTLVVLLAGLAGGYGGALAGRRASARAVRTATLLLSAGITLAFFWRAYG